MRASQVEGREDIKRARENDKKAKELQKKYKDNKSNVRAHTIKVGDELMLEQKSTKSKTPFDPDTFQAVAVHGSQITGRRGVELKTRDSQKWKTVNLENQKVFRRRKEEQDDADIGLPAHTQQRQVAVREEQAQPEGQIQREDQQSVGAEEPILGRTRNRPDYFQAGVDDTRRSGTVREEAGQEQQEDPRWIKLGSGKWMKVGGINWRR